MADEAKPTGEDRPAPVLVSARVIIRTLVIGALLIAIGGSVATVALVSGLKVPWVVLRLFYLDAEANIPTWFSSVLLATSALLLWINARAGRDFRRHFQILAAVFVALSLDEVAQIHEVVAIVMDKWHVFSGPFYFSWVVLAIPAVAVLAAGYWRLLWSLPARVRNLTIAAAALYVGGALGIEMVNGAYASLHGVQSPGYRILTIVEENLEISGLALWIYTLAQLLAVHQTSITIGFGDQATNGRSGHPRSETLDRRTMP